MAKITNYKDLIAWQKAMALAKEAYRLSRAFPADEKFGLTAQMRRAGAGVAANIAEGFGRSSRQDYLRFLDMARGSANEVETFALLAVDLEFIKTTEAATLLEAAIEVQKVLAGLIRSLRNLKSEIR